MNLLILTDEIFPDAIGGVGKSLYNEASALAKRGHSVRVIVRSHNPVLAKQELLNGLHVTRVQGPRKGSPLYYFYPLIMLFALTRALLGLQQQFDILIVHNPIFLLSAILSRITLRLPTVFVFHSSMAQEIRLNAARHKYGSLNGLALIAAKVLVNIEQFGYRRVDTIITRSHFMKSMLRELIDDVSNVMVIPIGLDTELYQPMARDRAKITLALEHQRPILITVRRLVARTGIENLIRALSILQTHGKDALLLVAGKGYLQPQIEQLVRDLNLEQSVRLLGFVAEDDLPVYLAAAELFVLPTEQLEGFGLATIEALAVGLPVIGTPVGATPEILQSINPLLVTADTSPEALAQTIGYWIDRHGELSDLSATCREEVKRLYDSDVVAQQLETLFMSMTRSSGTTQD